MITHGRTALAAIALAALLGFQAGCERGPTPEQLRADSTLVRARLAVTSGKIREARTLLYASLAQEERLGRTARQAEGLALLADVHAAMGLYDSALVLYRRAGEQYRVVADRKSSRGMTLQMASLRRLMGEERTAYTIYTEALRLARVFHDEQGVQEIGLAMLPCARAVAETSDERKIIEELLNASTAADNLRLLAGVHLEAGISELERHNAPGAIQQLLRSSTLARQVPDTVLTARVLVRLGAAYESTGDLRGAFQQYSEALRMTPRRRGTAALRIESVLRIANAYLRYRQLDDAVRFYRIALREAIAAGDRIVEGYSTLQLGHCALERAPAQAVGQFTSALDLFTSLGYGRGKAYARASLGAANERTGEVTGAIEHFRSAIDLAEELQSARSAEDMLSACEDAALGDGATYAYDRLTELLLQTGRSDEAFFTAQRKNASRLYPLLSRLSPVVPDKALEAMFREYRHLQALRIGAERAYRQALSGSAGSVEILQALHETHDRAAAALAAYYERLAPAGPELVPCMKIKGMNSADLQRRLPPGTALVQYIPTRRALYAFVVTSAGRSLELAAVDRERLMLTLRELAGEFRRYEAGSDSVKMELQGSDVRLKQLLHTASEWFIRPIMREIASGSTLIVVAMPDFPWLPLHAMPVRTASRSRYLAELVPVTYTPLVQSVRAPLRPVGPVRDVVSMGFAGRTLWDVEYELRDIRAFYKDARLYFTRQATLATLEAERADLLHLASPMIVDAHEPANSCIVLSDGKSLTTSRNVLLGELLSLPVYSGVVLSNLSPGATALHAGIPYVVLATGTGTVVMNAYVPWRTAKKYFSEVFYTSLLSGVTSEGAFRKVQLEMIKAPDYASPLVWAPFFLWRR